jgi:tetratricopeptide (TPR) repeat protein
VLALHTAVNTGLMLAQRRDQREGVFGVTGDAINTAARLVTVARTGEVVVGPGTYRAIAPFFATEPIGDVPLKGKAEPVPAHRVTGIVTRSAFELAQRRGLSPWLGRERELAELERRVAALRAGRGGVLAVCGEAGLGKSRLLHELARLAERAGIAVQRAHCASFGVIAPYAPFRELFCTGLDLAPGEAVEPSRLERLRDAGLADHLPVLLHLVSARSEGPGLPRALEGEALRGALHEAIAAYVASLAHAAPVLLVLEDWHWADPASELALRHLVRQLERVRVLLALSYRPSYRPSWQAADHSELALGPLSGEASEALIAAQFAPQSLPEGWRSQLAAHTGGNPFFIEELCRALGESGALTRAGLEPPSGGLAVPIPDSVEGVLRARIDRLDAVSADVLRAASVLGAEFSLPILERVVAGPQVGMALARLRDADLIQPMPDDPERQRFRHAITRQVAYEMILHRDRRLLHERAGRAMEEHFAGPRLEAHFEELAHHFANSDDRSRAVFFLECAGNKAAGSFALEQARAHYAAAVRLLAVMNPTPERLHQRIDLTFRWAQAGWYGPTREQIDALYEARRLALELGDHGRALRSLYFVGWLQHTMGENRRAVECFRECIEAADASDHRFLSQLYCNLGENLANETEHDEALAFLTRGVELRRQAFPEHWRTIGMAYALSYIGFVHADRGEFRVARECLDQALGIIGPREHGSALSSINQVGALILALQGDWEACLEAARLGQRVAHEIGAPPNHAMATAVEGWARFAGQREAGAIERLRLGIAQMAEAGTGLAVSLYLAALAEALAESGDLSGSLAMAERALARCETGDRSGEAAAHRARALALARMPDADVDGVRTALAAALALGAKKGSAREAALTELVAAECLRERGERALAAQHAERAWLAFARLSMKSYATRALALREALGA